jgi:Na+/proline symporter
MSLAPLDWIIIAAFLAISFLVGILFARRAGKSTSDFFLSGRNLPWWLVGTSMVATTFGADTPLAVTGLVAKGGVAANWVWWSFALGGMFTVFFFARLWRRAGIMTDVELAEIRYGGRPAAWLRGFRALYLAVPINLLVIGWVNVAMATILEVTLGVDKLTAVLACLVLCGVYASLSGLWGVVVTDFIQFGFAMAGTVALAIVALDQPEVGGLAGLRGRLPEGTLDFFTGPDAASIGGLGLASFVAYVSVQWWATWYPGAEPGGGGYVVQRMMAAKNERHALYATLWFTIAHYCLRPWPWILVGLASLLLYPDLADGQREAGYVMVIRDHLPVGLRGMLVATFLAAYMSTISTQLNWGCSYLTNDFYRRFIRSDAPEEHYVRFSRLATLGLMIAGGVVTFFLKSVGDSWTLIFELGAGTGLVMMLRWYWWRINAWSEIVAMAGAAVGFAGLKIFTDIAFPWSLLALTGWTTACWLVATLATPAESDELLLDFYRRARPDGFGWGRIARLAGEPTPGGLAGRFVAWCAGWLLVYGTLFAVGALLLKTPGEALAYLGVAAAGLATLLWRMRNDPGVLS